MSYGMNQTLVNKIKKETTKALLVENDNGEFWMPKSQVSVHQYNSGELLLTYSQWIKKEEITSWVTNRETLRLKPIWIRSTNGMIDQTRYQIG